MARELGKNQLALLLIVDQSTRRVGGEAAGAMFLYEESIRYTGIDGEPAQFFMMTRDLKSLQSLCDRGLIRKTTIGYSSYYTITEDGRIEVERLRGIRDPSYRPQV